MGHVACYVFDQFMDAVARRSILSPVSLFTFGASSTDCKYAYVSRTCEKAPANVALERLATAFMNGLGCQCPAHRGKETEP